MTETLGTPGPNVITSAISWFSGVLVGSFATSIAVIAIATMGLLLLFGRIDIKRMARVVLGCFIIFGASAIAHGILDAFSARDVGADHAQASLPPPPPPPRTRINPTPNASPTTPGANPFDPYGSGSTQQR